jgi:hypothetical protein
MNNTEESLVTVWSTPSILSDGQPFIMPSLKAIESDPVLDTYIDPTPFNLGEDDEQPRERSEWTAPCELTYLS